MKTVSAVIALLLWASLQVSGQNSTTAKDSDNGKKVVFKTQNIALQGALVVSQNKSIYGGKTPSQIGRSYYEGFVRQPVGIGYDLSLKYYIIRKKGILVDAGIGFWSYAVNYTAIEDSVKMFNPGSGIRKYSDRKNIFYIPLSASYLIKDRVAVGVKASLPIVSETSITSPDSSFEYGGFWQAFDWIRFSVEGQVGYQFKTAHFILTPFLSFGGIPKANIRPTFLYKMGLTIQYQRHEK